MVSIPIGQFSMPLQWQLWTLCLDNVNYSIFFGINFEAQNFSTNNHKKGSILKYQSTSRNKFWTTILPTTAPRKKHPFEQPKTTTNQLWKSPQTWHILNQLITGQTLKGQNPTLTNAKMFFSRSKTLKISPIFRDLKCFQHRCMARLECCSPVTQLWCLGVWYVGKNATWPTEPSARSHGLVISRLLVFQF